MEHRPPLDKDMGKMPIRIVANGVLTRSVRDTAAFYRKAEKTWRRTKLDPIGDVTGPAPDRLRVAVFTKSVKRDHPYPRPFVDDFLLYWHCWRSRWCAVARAGSGSRSTAVDSTT